MCPLASLQSLFPDEAGTGQSHSWKSLLIRLFRSGCASWDTGLPGGTGERTMQTPARGWVLMFPCLTLLPPTYTAPCHLEQVPVSPLDMKAAAFLFPLSPNTGSPCSIYPQEPPQSDSPCRIWYTQQLPQVTQYSVGASGAKGRSEQVPHPWAEAMEAQEWEEVSSRSHSSSAAELRLSVSSSDSSIVNFQGLLSCPHILVKACCFGFSLFHKTTLSW